MFRSRIFTAALSLIAVGSTQAIAQQPAPQERKPSAFDQPLVAEESYEKPQKFRRTEFEAYLRKELAVNAYRQRIIAAEEKARRGVEALRPTQPSNFRMYNYYVPRRIIYVPPFVD